MPFNSVFFANSLYKLGNILANLLLIFKILWGLSKQCFSNFKVLYKQQSQHFIYYCFVLYLFTDVRRPSHLGIWALTFLQKGYFLILDKYKVFQKGIFHSDCMLNVKVPEGHYCFQVSLNDICLKQPRGTVDCSSFIVRI